MRTKPKPAPLFEKPVPKANDVTGEIIKFLTYHHYTVWRQNTTGIFDKERGVWRKNPTTKKGVSDIIGFDPSGRFVAIEIKVGRDRISDDQAKFLAQVHEAGGLAMIARSLDDFFTKWYERRKKQ